MARDRMILKGMCFYGYHGTSRTERQKGQKYYMDIEMRLDLEPAGKSDRLTHTLDYTQVYSLAREIQGKKKYHLLEALAEDIAKAVLEKFGKVYEITVKVRKPQAPVGGLMEYVEVEVNRSRVPKEAWGSKIR